MCPVTGRFLGCDVIYRGAPGVRVGAQNGACGVSGLVVTAPAALGFLSQLPDSGQKKARARRADWHGGRRGSAHNDHGKHKYQRIQSKGSGDGRPPRPPVTALNNGDRHVTGCGDSHDHGRIIRRGLVKICFHA